MCLLAQPSAAWRGPCKTLRRLLLYCCYARRRSRVATILVHAFPRRGSRRAHHASLVRAILRSIGPTRQTALCFVSRQQRLSQRDQRAHKQIVGFQVGLLFACWARSKDVKNTRGSCPAADVAGRWRLAMGHVEPARAARPQAAWPADD